MTFGLMPAGEGCRDARATNAGLELELRPARGSRAVFVSPVVRCREFQELILSWNVDVPANCGVWFEARVLDDRGWSPWLFMGAWGDVEAPGPLTTAWAGGGVDIDVLRSATAVSMAQVRACAVRDDDSAEPVMVRALHLITTSTSRLAARPPRGDEPHGRAVWLDVPFKTQRTRDPDLTGRACSPTSVAMVLSFRGLEYDLAEVAARVRDRRNDIFGNWPLNVQGAYSFGAPMHIRRFSAWSDVEDVLRSGRPIIASVQVAKGELANSPYEETDGHLLVITGIDEAGDIRVNDPAGADEVRGRLVYPRGVMTTAWLIRGKGTAYVLDN